MTTPQRLYDEAVLNYEGARVELDAAIKRLGYAEGFEAGREFDRKKPKDVIETMRVFEEVYGGDPFPEVKITELTPQELRDEIVERAKADVEAIETGDIFEYAYSYYVVNREKRTVVALIYPAYGNERVEARGIAKCAPNDCFNSALGKAIALRRALGLTVPDEYLNAPNPTEVRVGNVVDMGIPNHERELVSATEHNASRNIVGINCAKLWIAEGQARIIDDSRE